MKLFSSLLLLLVISCSQADQKSALSSTLQKCPSSPNCVISLFSADKEHFMPPIDEFPDAIEKIKIVLKQMNLTIINEEEGYIHAKATSSFFKFIDDIQIKIVGEKIHFRSASRRGHSDFGVNRKRMNKFKLLLHRASIPTSK